jgi:predicted lipoprotein
MDVRPNPDRTASLPWVAWAVVTLGAVALLWRFPLWRVVPLEGAAPAKAVATFDAAEYATHFWTATQPSLRTRAVDAKELVGALRRDPAAALKTYAPSAGLGTAYFHVRGTGRVVAVERNRVVLTIDGADGATVALQTGAIFGNTVRDGLAVLNVNDFPSLTDFNALAAELNRQVEQRVLPGLRTAATLGALVDFAGCAEATDPVADQPVLTITPVFAEVHPAR